MTEQPQTSDALTARALLGMIAYLELAAFSRLARDAALAPTLGERLRLSGMARGALEQMDRVEARVVELGGERGGGLEAAMTPFAGVLVDFDERTEPGSWWERLLKAYVGYGVADDFCRVLARPLDPQTRALAEDVLDDAALAELVTCNLQAAGTDDATLTSRLALWGRRLFGESLGVVQQVLTAHPPTRDLLVQAMEDGEPGEAQTRLFTELTAAHTRRMDRLGLTA